MVGSRRCLPCLRPASLPPRCEGGGRRKMPVPTALVPPWEDGEPQTGRVGAVGGAAAAPRRLAGGTLSLLPPRPLRKDQEMGRVGWGPAWSSSSCFPRRNAPWGCVWGVGGRDWKRVGSQGRLFLGGEPGCDPRWQRPEVAPRVHEAVRYEGVKGHRNASWSPALCSQRPPFLCSGASKDSTAGSPAPRRRKCLC